MDESHFSLDFNDPNDANNLPSLPKLDMLQTQEFASTQGDTGANTATDVAASSCAIINPPPPKKSSSKAKCKIISFVNKCIRAKKSLFLLSSNDIVYDKIGDDAFLNGKVLTIPSKGTEVYKIFWDMSPLSIRIDKSKLRLSIC
jgi:hypothetical protein